MEYQLIISPFEDVLPSTLIQWYNNPPFQGNPLPRFSASSGRWAFLRKKHAKKIRKTTVVSEKVPIRQDLKYVHPLAQNLFPIFTKIKVDETSQPNSFIKVGIISSGLRSSTNVKKRCHSDGGKISKWVFKSNIFVGEKDSGCRPVINLRKLNQNILYIYFKMEGLSVLKEFLQGRSKG